MSAGLGALFRDASGLLPHCQPWYADLAEPALSFSVRQECLILGTACSLTYSMGLNGDWAALPCLVGVLVVVLVFVHAVAGRFGVFHFSVCRMPEHA